MIIEIDGRKPKAPDYAKFTSRDESFYLSALNASLVGWGAYERALQHGVQALADTFKKDPNHKEIIADCLRPGPARIQSWHFEYLASGLANMLAKDGDHLELVDLRDPEQVKIETQKRVRKDPGIGPSFYETRIGQSLSDGRLVFRGNVDKISGLRGGSVFVEGDVKKIETTGSGIIFVDGDVNIIDEAKQTIIVITGELGKYQESRVHHRYALREGSPFIFASKVGEVDNRLYKGQVGSLLELNYPTEVDLTSMKGWSPAQALEASFDMARSLATSHAEAVLNFAKGASKAEDLSSYARLQMLSHIMGYQLGYTRGELNSVPASVYD
ncbi:MAG: hypothetical protein PHQ59_04935 [Candidatus Daviesbacteria bacterium]|nr:hypothetical protein [Candidatus Daviesbacteria bacterium]